MATKSEGPVSNVCNRYRYRQGRVSPRWLRCRWEDCSSQEDQAVWRLVPTFEKLPCCIIGMEACLSAHFVSRTLRKLGFESRIIPAIYVKPFLKGQKNDYNDAEAIAEAALRPNLRTVREKDPGSAGSTGACIGFGRGWFRGGRQRSTRSGAFLIEQGIAVRKGAKALRKSLFPILDLRRDEISERMHDISHRPL